MAAASAMVGVYGAGPATANSNGLGEKHKPDIPMLLQQPTQQQQQHEEMVLSTHQQPQGFPSVEQQQQQQQQAPQLSLPDWSDLSGADSALLAMLRVVGCGFERMRMCRDGMQRLQQLPAGATALHRFRADYQWLQLCLEHREEVGAMEEFAKGLNQLVDSLQ
jgi:ABC-type transporter Mla MlaB component